jgi:polyhydroxybutyrate depolymerase
MKSSRFGGMRIALAACLAAMVGAQGLRAQETKETVTVDDVDRTFMVRLPRGYDASRRYPVMILLHGMNQDADDMERLTRFDDLADKDSVIAVYPMALHGRWNIGVHPPEHGMMPMGPGRRRGGYPGGGYPGGGYPGGGYPGGGGGYPGGGQQPQSREPEERRSPPADDVAFFNQMLDQLGTKFSVDSSRVYAAGLSEGGFMSMRLGCALSDRIAGIATIGAAMPKNMMCLPTRPVPIVMINGTSDPVVPYGGGTEHNLDLPTISVEDSAKAWAKIDHCAEKPENTKLPKEKGGTETKIDTFAGCQQGTAVVLYSLKGIGNTWPGGLQYQVEQQVGKTSNDFNANETLWSFLVTKKLPEKGSTQP